ncbi:MAG: polymerase beta domain protein region protein [Microgenomates group bacterium GW2011_GWC1_43_11]|uniref:Polymerase beta domain protein region protein n=1 Tax=Candidatus Gottesmanbacteria bacterium GW2011_GWA1_44_24b TaxID=1618437 RepID=A0A0G1IKI7_9BACT|nr:MAG: polymerase beta domain protein region protein [Microgenomates group bacterium GW2011_GWC1_43_11]KKT59398.1 MAG: polymerase beta domain protein region protein [Candidatus Gottesmanbacteria bacterium GW2011_GWA1_44_24b]
MKTQTALKILDFIKKKGKARPHDLVRFLGISHVALHKQLRGLITKGLLVKQGDAPCVSYAFPQSTMGDLRSIIREAIPILKRYNIRKAALFGSVVRGDSTPASDVDMLIDPPPDFSLFDRAGLTVDLEETLHRPVDVVDYKSIKPLLRESILHYEYPFL